MARRSLAPNHVEVFLLQLLNCHSAIASTHVCLDITREWFVRCHLDGCTPRTDALLLRNPDREHIRIIRGVCVGVSDLGIIDKLDYRVVSFADSTLVVCAYWLRLMRAKAAARRRLPIQCKGLRKLANGVCPIRTACRSTYHLEVTRLQLRQTHGI